MASRTLRRRLHHGDVDGKRNEHLEGSLGLDGLDEPLLGNYEHDDRHSEVDTLEDIWDEERRKERLHWTLLFSQLIAQWAQWKVVGEGFGRKVLLRCDSIFKFRSANFKIISARRFTYSHPHLPLEEERCKNLRERLEVPFDGSRVEHQDALKQLWRLAYPDRELPSLKSELWKEMGWQGSDPSTDFRGGGFISLENLIFFAQRYPLIGCLCLELFELIESFHRLLHKQDGTRAEWEYPFAVAGINISFMLAQMLDLQSGKPTSLAGIRFLELLGEDEMAFDDLYCVAFQMMDAQWLAKRASYMEFNDVLKSTRTQLERELALEDVSNVRDLPAYNLLKR
uniref:ELMO domain-containing protein n=1 Tax=Fagus sylvatica TaxID=28930 RepID=A0A2N9GD60_FAGSY